MDLRQEDYPGDEWQALNLPTSISIQRPSTSGASSPDERFESPINEYVSQGEEEEEEEFEEEQEEAHFQGEVQDQEEEEEEEEGQVTPTPAHEKNQEGLAAPQAAAHEPPIMSVATVAQNQVLNTGALDEGSRRQQDTQRVVNLSSSPPTEQNDHHQHQHHHYQQNQYQNQRPPHEQQQSHQPSTPPTTATAFSSLQVEVASPPRLTNEAASPVPSLPSPPSQLTAHVQMYRPEPSRSPLVPSASGGASPVKEDAAGTGRKELQEHEMLLFQKTMKKHGSSISSSESSPHAFAAAGAPHSSAFPHPHPHQHGHSESNNTLSPGAQLSQWKEWAAKTFRTSWQALNERLGNAAPTSDPEVQGIIDGILAAQKAYENIQRLVSLLINHFEDVVKVQKQLSAAFGELGVKSPELADVFNCNHDAQRTLHKNGMSLIGAMAFFVQNLHTMTSKTMEDTIGTYRELHTVRLEFDAFKQSHASHEAKHASREKLDEIAAHIERTRKRMEELRAVFKLKAQLLDENRLKVVHKQLLLFHNATCAYFAGNQTQLEETMTKFHVPSGNSEGW